MELLFFAHGEEMGNLLPQIFATYYDCIPDNVPFTRYIEILENKYNNGTQKFWYKDLMYKA